ncbi:aldo/keto reductase [Deinococcus seoulensis]|uniref:Aldo/keto reductase n=2 Tax=Deinococcus seoulensis TaxID=1837379 RepID=A0ABQ2RVX9_9DEIO|nr:aldo/keto reductase [Deinococcus seoulensis]
MRTMKLGTSTLDVPVIAVGCMRINELDRAGAERFVQQSMEMGANFFDHADIYGGGECERIFADAAGMSSSVRERMILQSKCGIRVDLGMFDFSREHILASVDGILERLRTDYLDVLLLHRPDALVEPDEVAAAFDQLEREGKVRHFGVSNQTPMQIELLKKSVRQPLVANQLQLSVTNATMITRGFNVNMENDSAVDRDGGVLDYCRLHDITVQPWSPFQFGFFEGVFLDNPKFPELNAVIDQLAGQYGVSNTTIAIAWLLRHPAHMQPVTGTTKVERLRDCARAADVNLTRQEWYAVLRAAGNTLP